MIWSQMHDTSADRDADVGPANTADPDSSSSTLKTPLLLAEIADRAAITNMFAASTTSISSSQVIQFHAVSAVCQPGAAILAARGPLCRGCNACHGGRGAAWRGIDVPKAVQRLLVV